MPRARKKAGVEQPRLPLPCPACGESLQADGMCVGCQAYFSPAPPDRCCGACARLLTLDGYCHSCREYQGPRLDPGERRGIPAWVVRWRQRACTLEESRRGLAAAKAVADQKLAVPERLEVLRRVAANQPGVGWEEALEELALGWVARPPAGRGPDVAGALAALPPAAGGRGR